MGRTKKDNPIIGKIICNENNNKWLIIKEIIGGQIFHPSFDEYIKNLQLAPMANAPSLCIICFCLLSICQISLH